VPLSGGKAVSEQLQDAATFYGKNKHSIDQKGRAILPAGFRAKLGDKFMIAEWMDECLCIFTGDEWKKISEKIQSNPSTDVQVRRFVRKFFSGAAELEPDKQGRVMIPAELRAYAGLKKEILIVGTGSRIEVWDKKRWEDYDGQEESNITNMGEALAQLGI